MSHDNFDSENILVTKSILEPPNKGSLLVASLFHQTANFQREKQRMQGYMFVCLSVSLSIYIYPTQYINVPITHLPANPQTLHSILSIQRNYQHLLSLFDNLSNSFKED